MAAYTQGEFCWYELATRDISAAVRFYEAFMNWRSIANDMGEMGSYYIFQLDGQDVGGGYQMSGPQFDGVPPHWLPYVWVDDVDAVAGKVAAPGGKVVAPPMDIHDVGRMAVLQDPQGAHICIFKGREHHGAARLQGKPGSFVWAELMTTNAGAARKFYGELLGWTFSDFAPASAGMQYTICQVSGNGVAGMMQMEGPEFEGVPPHWTPYLSVADCDAAVAKASELKAKVLVPVQDVPGAGRFSTLQDPTGAVIAILAPRPM